jgi:hypothetical protein
VAHGFAREAITQLRTVQDKAEARGLDAPPKSNRIKAEHRSGRGAVRGYRPCTSSLNRRSLSVSHSPQAQTAQQSQTIPPEP